MKVTDWRMLECCNREESWTPWGSFQKKSSSNSWAAVSKYANKIMQCKKLNKSFSEFASYDEINLVSCLNSKLVHINALYPKQSLGVFWGFVSHILGDFLSYLYIVLCGRTFMETTIATRRDNSKIFSVQYNKVIMP